MTETICGCGRPTAGAVLCEDCTTTFRWAIVNVAAYTADLETVRTKRARYGSTGATKGSIGKAQPLPVDSRFANGAPRLEVFGGVGGSVTAPGTQLRWDVWNTVVAWCRTVMEDQPELHGPACIDCLHVSCSAVRRRRWPANNVASMIHYLTRQFRLICSEQWAPVMMDEFLDLERRLCRMIDRPADRWYAGKCSASDENGQCNVDLYATSDRGTIDCPGCDTRHDVAKRREFLLDEAKGILVTATEAASALLAWTDYDGSENKLIDRIRKWRDRGHLDVQDVTSLHGRDRHLYRLGDIQDLLIRRAQSEQQRRIGA
jgi:hypothetical protein